MRIGGRPRFFSDGLHHDIGNLVQVEGLAEVGGKVARWKPGDRVVLLPQVSCGTCEACQAGNNSQCPNLETLEANPRYNGGYAQFLIVGEGDALMLPDSVSFADAAVVGTAIVEQVGRAGDDRDAAVANVVELVTALADGVRSA